MLADHCLSLRPVELRGRCRGGHRSGRQSIEPAERRETLTPPAGVVAGGEVDWQAVVRRVIEQLKPAQTTSVTALVGAVDLVGGRVSRTELVGYVLRLGNDHVCRVGTDGALIESGRIYPMAEPGPDAANVPWRVNASGSSWRAGT